MRQREESYNDTISRLYPKNEPRDINASETANLSTKNVTFQVTDACNLRCTYCYQINKQNHKMPLEVAKKFIDLLLKNDETTRKYCDSENSNAIILEFIGGEPFLEVDLIEEIYQYFMERCLELDHQWLYHHRISICSNGTLYFTPKVQEFIKRHKDNLSFSISIDGNKELHDACRIFPDGKGSYDIAHAAMKDYVAKYHQEMGSKMTLAPGNIEHTFEAGKALIEDGYRTIHLNCVYEEGWEINHAKILYNQLKRLADYILENDLEDELYMSIFEENMFRPKMPNDIKNWCWGAGTLILTENGYVPIENIKIGDMVYTEDGSLHSVINTTNHFANNVVQIKMSGTNNLVCTDNHKVFALPFDYRGNKGIKHFKPYGKYQIKDLGARDYISLFKLPLGHIDINKELAYLVGRYLGDGWDVREGRGHLICCSFEETKELEKYFIKGQIDYTIQRGNTTNYFNISINHSNKNNELLHTLLSAAGHLAINKKLPPECLKWNRESLKALLNGYFDADGCLHKSGQKRANTISYELSEDILLLLRSLGYTPSSYYNKRGGHNKILNREVTIKDRYEIGYYEDSARSRYVKCIDNKLYTSHLSITPAEPQLVYNITVADNHSYVANGINSSNCGGNGAMISVDYKGDIYPCIRYMESSLGEDQKPLIVGNVDRGILTTEEEQQMHKCLTCIDRRSQSTDECFYCPIAEGCSWCTAYNYQVFGTPDKRATYICIMHKARALANAYYWNSVYRKQKENKRFKIWIPDKWALEIIDKNELNMLKELEKF